ncbi:MAG: malonic semialdehyde reductase [Xanthomonadaceae bacterium]|jgi:3-hydroxypropanoate dehydrogenase|nr:malonic semialdehyde reductase [Xanthomonadaceae bacterium]
MSHVLSDSALDQLFRTARTANAFTDQPVDDAVLHQLYELLKWGPTALNATPARFVFVKSAEAKQKLAPTLAEGNVAKTMAAPVTVIVGYDEDFHNALPQLFPHNPGIKDGFEGPREKRHDLAFRNGTLQGAYLIMAARALGLDTGAMSGFDNARVDAAFFVGTSIRSNFLINLGYADHQGTFPRLPRLRFDEAARIV